MIPNAFSTFADMPIILLLERNQFFTPKSDVLGMCGIYKQPPAG